MVTNDTNSKEETHTPKEEIRKEEQKPEEKQTLKEVNEPEEEKDRVIYEEQEPEETKELEGEQKPEEELKQEEEQKPEEEEEPEEKELEKQQKPPENFPIVGIGASAGGLGAFEAFFSGIPADVNSGVAFVLIQHLDPKHKSMLADLIGRYTSLPVYEIKDEMDVKPNCVYVIPSNSDLIYREGKLHLQEPIKLHGRRMPIDLFFRSLAEEKKEMAIGIVLSGTGSDGTLGIRVIKSEGGMVMAQSPETSEYDSMPRSVIDAGLADYILPPKEMPAQLIAYVTQAFEKEAHLTVRAEDYMNRIFDLVFTQIGHDFSHYKKGTINRRIERRMAVHSMKRIEEYVHYLEKNPGEVEALYRDFLISVTGFFRNPKAFDKLQEEVIPNLFMGKRQDDLIRIWVTGCSTGEEAYSIGIMLQEYMEYVRRILKILIFATDIDSRAIERARAGVYPASIAVDVSAERLERFFTMGPDGNYRINKNIREIVIFSEHDLIKDPPFSKIDLLSCRNVLIYMDGELQKRLIPLFYYALNPGKYLFLGSSESIYGFTDLFDTIDRSAKLYQSRPNVGAEKLRSVATFLPSRLESREFHGKPEETPALGKPKYREMTEQILLQNYAPVGVLVNKNGDILYTYGRTGMYLELATGEAGFNILKMAREGLHQRLLIALHRAAIDKKPSFSSGVQVKTNGDVTSVNLTIIPVTATPFAADGPDLYLVIFEKPQKWEQKKIEEAAAGAKGEALESGTEVDQRISELMEQLRVKEEELKATNEDWRLPLKNLNPPTKKCSR